MAKATYHHGDLRRALLTAAAEAINEHGVAALSMRDLARRAGVSHAAPTHHFGDKAGLLTALATAGFDRLAEALSDARRVTGSFLELGVTYVRFAVAHQAEFEVMYRPDLYRPADPALQAARSRAAATLYAAVADLPDSTRGPSSDVRTAGLAAWSMAHGFATLWLSGAFPDRTQDPTDIARNLFLELNREGAAGRSGA
jgi:AcrR family transcriptional regulator